MAEALQGVENNLGLPEVNNVDEQSNHEINQSLEQAVQEMLQEEPYIDGPSNPAEELQENARYEAKM